MFAHPFVVILANCNLFVCSPCTYSVEDKHDFCACVGVTYSIARVLSVRYASKEAGQGILPSNLVSDYYLVRGIWESHNGERGSRSREHLCTDGVDSRRGQGGGTEDSRLVVCCSSSGWRSAVCFFMNRRRRR